MKVNVERRRGAAAQPAPSADGGSLAADLAAAVGGEVRFDRGSRRLYANDASIYRQVPIGVVIPRDADDVVAAVQVCRRHGAPIVARGCGTGLAGQSVNIDYQAAAVDSGTRFQRNVPGHTSAGYRPPVRVPRRADLEAAAEALAGRRRIVILAGAGARGAGAGLEELAEKLGAPIVKAMLGKDCVPDDSPYTTGRIALVGTRPSEEVLEQCDALVIVGSTMPYIEYYPEPGQAVCVQIDDKPERIGLRCPVDVALVGDAGATLRELLPLLRRNDDRALLQQAQQGMEDWWKLMEERGGSTDVPMKPQVPAWQLWPLLDDDAIVCGDSGTVTTWAARQIKLRRNQRFLFSGTNCSMAAGLPYGIGAQAAHPGRQVVVFTGDGSLTMQLGDFVTCVQHDLPVKVIVVKNNTLGLIKWEQMVFLGNPEYGVNMAPVDFVKFAEACGARGTRIEDPSRCRDQLADALALDGPVIVEAVVDEHEPPYPARVKREQVAKLTKALRTGTPNRRRIALQMVKDMLDESSFDASPGGVLPDGVGERAAGVVGRLLDREGDRQEGEQQRRR